jgi:hypothetical protein
MGTHTDDTGLQSNSTVKKLVVVNPLILVSHLSKSVNTTWFTCPPDRTRVRYDGIPGKIGTILCLMAKL